MLAKVELLDRFRLTHYNYKSLETEKELAWKSREEVLIAKEEAKGRVWELEGKLWR